MRHRASLARQMVAVGLLVLVSVSGVVALVSAPSVGGAGSAAPPRTSALTAAFGAPPPSNAGAAMAETAIKATHALHLDSRVVSVPRPSAPSSEVARARAEGHVSPLYFDAPAPVGVADTGLGAGPGGSVVPSIVNTTSLRGQIDTTPPGIYGLDLADRSPDAYGV